jgi:hypothetical protein
MVRCARESSLITSEGSGSTDCLTFGEFCVFATPAGIDFTKLIFGRKISSLIFILEYVMGKKYHPKTVERHLSIMDFKAQKNL